MFVIGRQQWKLALFSRYDCQRESLQPPSFFLPLLKFIANQIHFPMTISEKQVVSVNYHLTVPGEDNSAEEITIEKTSTEEPFVFLYGAGQLLPLFEKNLAGKKAGDKFNFRVPAEEGYGTYQLDHVVNLPIENFLGEDGKLDTEMIALGKNVPMVDNEGHRLWGKVLEISLQHIKMDFNHPLAGKELHFDGEVLDVREATADELDHGHVHGAGGHHH